MKSNRKRSIKNRVQLALLLGFVALLNLGQSSNSCDCKNPEDGELIKTILEYTLSVSPLFIDLTPGQPSSVRFTCPEKDRGGLPVAVSVWPGLTGVVTSQQPDGAAVVFVAAADPEKNQKMSWSYDPGYYNENEGVLKTQVAGKLLNMLPLSSGGQASCSITVATVNPDFALPWQRENLRFKGPAIATPRLVSFPDTSVGKSCSREVVLQNKGDQDLTATFSISPGERFTSTSGPVVVVPGVSLSITVEYRPKSAGSDWASFLISSNDPKYPAIAVQLSGYGVVQAPPS